MVNYPNMIEITFDKWLERLLKTKRRILVRNHKIIIHYEDYPKLLKTFPSVVARYDPDKETFYFAGFQIFLYRNRVELLWHQILI